MTCPEILTNWLIISKIGTAFLISPYLISYKHLLFKKFQNTKAFYRSFGGNYPIALAIKVSNLITLLLHGIEHIACLVFRQ